MNISSPINVTSADVVDGSSGSISFMCGNMEYKNTTKSYICHIQDVNCSHSSEYHVQTYTIVYYIYILCRSEYNSFARYYIAIVHAC